jgi:hypothetical protein
LTGSNTPMPFAPYAATDGGPRTDDALRTDNVTVDF